MNDATEDDDMLEAMFRAARSAPPEAPPALLARIEADAHRLKPSGPRAAPAAGRRGLAGGGLATSGLAGSLAGSLAGGGLRRLVDMLGGWRAMGGLATATLAGIWIGFAGLGSIETTAGGLIGYGAAPVTVDLMPDLGDADLTMENGQ